MHPDHTLSSSELSILRVVVLGRKIMIFKNKKVHKLGVLRMSIPIVSLFVQQGSGTPSLNNAFFKSK